MTDLVTWLLLQLDFASELNRFSAEDFKSGQKKVQMMEYIQQDYVKADIYYQTLNVKSIKQDRKYTVSHKGHL